MSKILIKSKHRLELDEVNAAITMLNVKKIRILFKILGILMDELDFANITAWELILIVVPDKQMAVQLNKLSASIPNIKFVVDGSSPAFALLQGEKGRRVWKER